MIRHHASVLCLLMACAWPVFAAPPAPASDRAATALPAWEQLTPAQRDLLLAPARERWNGNPGERARMFEHAQRWRSMTPEQRQSARRGMKRWSNMPPEKRAHARALFEKMRDLPPERRKALREQLKAMTPEQRRTWLRQNAPD